MISATVTVTRNVASGSRCRNRALEWFLAVVMTGMSIPLLLTPKTIEMGAFKHIVNAGLTPRVLACYLVFFGAMRLFALWANGKRKPWSAWVRVVGCASGIFLWAEMSIALLNLSADVGTISFGLPMWIAAVGAEIFCCWRAAGDARHG